MRRHATLLLVACAAIALSTWWLDLWRSPLIPDQGGLQLLGRFAAAAVRPTLTDAHTGQSLVPALGLALWNTVRIAAAAMALALIAAVPLSLLASTRLAPRAPWIWPVRTLITALRSVHELLWAIVLLAAVGQSEWAAVLAIAIPYAGTLAKVFSELIDEAPPDAADALRHSGAPPTAAFALGQLSRTLPDLAAYAFYRFECALRSAAILGFFGVPTIGVHLATAVDNVQLPAVWTWLYALAALVLLVHGWSGVVRRRMGVR